MKKVFLMLTLTLILENAYTQAKYEFKQITTVESVVPGGLGRSRLIATDAKNQEVELSLENFFSFVGINFGNIRNNDKVITDKISDMANEGWELTSVNTGVYGVEKSTGIFITRYLFKREKK